MRSLYTDDIPGASPTKRVYEKTLITARHDEEIDRFSRKNLLKRRIIDWYIPIERHVEPIDRADTFKYKPNQKKITLSEFNQRGNSLSHSIVNYQDVIGKVTEIDQQLSKSSVLTKSAIKSISLSPEYDQSPYFPHKYRDFDREYNHKWTGRRNWNEQYAEKVPIPNVSSQYYPKWC